MICYGFKGGDGTASRVLPKDQGGYTVGVLVQCNCGRRPQLTIAGVPVGKEIPRNVPYAMFHDGKAGETEGDLGSIIIVIATDAPLLPHQLKRLARRATMGLARTGSTSGNGSGDIFLAFSTANPHAWDDSPSPHTIQTVANEHLSPIFQATVEATEEAIVNALVAVTRPHFQSISVYEILTHFFCFSFLGRDFLAVERPCQGRSEAEPVRVALIRLVDGHTLCL
jgi:L-aminopeptidase/D-esterase-like protein